MQLPAVPSAFFMPKTTSFSPAQIGNQGIWFAAAILTSWLALLSFLLTYHSPGLPEYGLTLSWKDPLVYVFVLLQMHLYTGVFITAHDAIHGVVAPNNKRLNNIIGTLATRRRSPWPRRIWERGFRKRSGRATPPSRRLSTWGRASRSAPKATR